MKKIHGYQPNKQNNNITVIINDDNNFRVLRFNYSSEIIDLIHKNEVDKLIELKSPKVLLNTILGDIVQTEDKYYLKGTDIPLPSNLMDFILSKYRESYNVDSLIKFWSKAIKCDRRDVAESLFDFLQQNDMPITEEGNVVAWKRVRTRDSKGLEVPRRFVGVNFYANKVWKDGVEVDKQLESDYLTWLYQQSQIDLVDCHTGKILNNVGLEVVFTGTPNYNREDHCSEGGLHVANEKYAREFYPNKENGVLILVEFNPSDVISCPTDHNFAKLRVKRYRVLSIVPE